MIPKDLKCGDVMLHSLWARRHGTKYNGAPYIVQKAGEAVYSETGKAQLKEQVAYYMKNASVIYDGLKEAGYNVSGGVNAPYIWLETPKGMTSWEFFDYLLEKANVWELPVQDSGQAARDISVSLPLDLMKIQSVRLSGSRRYSEDEKRDASMYRMRASLFYPFMEGSLRYICSNLCSRLLRTVNRL